MLKTSVYTMGMAAALFLVFQPVPIDDVKGMIHILYGEHKGRKLVTGDLRSEKDDYDKHYGEHKTDAEALNEYYNLVTDHYEYGWGQSFHFAHTLATEGFDASLQRYQHRFADLLGVGAGSKILECGCAIGSAGRAVAVKTGAHVKGVTINEYQAALSTKFNKAYDLEDRVQVAVADFGKLPDADSTFDGAFSIEGTTHASSLDAAYAEVFRVLKPGSKFVVSEWVTTETFDANNATHAKLIADIEYSNGVPKVHTKAEVLKAAAAAGFTVISDEDLALDKEGTLPWYHRLITSTSPILRAFSTFTSYISERAGASPPGTLAVQKMLFVAADSLREAGEENIFTPLHLFVLEKPGAAAKPAVEAKPQAEQPKVAAEEPKETHDEL